MSGGVPALTSSYNITSIADTGVGNLGVTIATDFSSANYAVSACLSAVVASATIVTAIESQAAGSLQLRSNVTASAADADPVAYHASMFGDQA